MLCPLSLLPSAPVLIRLSVFITHTGAGNCSGLQSPDRYLAWLPCTAPPAPVLLQQLAAGAPPQVHTRAAGSGAVGLGHALALLASRRL